MPSTQRPIIVRCSSSLTAVYTSSNPLGRSFVSSLEYVESERRDALALPVADRTYEVAANEVFARDAAPRVAVGVEP